MTKRDLQADLEWVNDPDVCISPKVREICNHAIRRAMDAEAENANLREQLEQVQAQAAAMREALLNINELGNCDKCGQTYILHDIADVKHKALSTTAGREYAERMRKLEAVAEAARELCIGATGAYNPKRVNVSKIALKKLKVALAALEGGQ